MQCTLHVHRDYHNASCTALIVNSGLPNCEAGFSGLLITKHRTSLSMRGLSLQNGFTMTPTNGIFPTRNHSWNNKPSLWVLSGTYALCLQFTHCKTCRFINPTHVRSAVCERRTDSLQWRQILWCTNITACTCIFCCVSMSLTLGLGGKVGCEWYQPTTRSCSCRSRS